MLHLSGLYDQEKLEEALKRYLPFDGESIQSYDVEYMDDDLGLIMLANFIWLNEQWVYVDSRNGG
jgi:hypothetical protein